MNKKAVLLAVTLPVTWLLTIWISYWSGFYSHSEISNFIEEDSQVTHLMEQKYILKNLNEGKVESVKDALVEQISLDSSIVDALHVNRDESGWSLLQAIYPQEALKLIAVQEKKESEKKAQK